MVEGGVARIKKKVKKALQDDKSVNDAIQSILPNKCLLYSPFKLLDTTLIYADIPDYFLSLKQ
jgi:hypothetical protein